MATLPEESPGSLGHTAGETAGVGNHEDRATETETADGWQQYRQGCNGGVRDPQLRRKTQAR